MDGRWMEGEWERSEGRMGKEKYVKRKAEMRGMSGEGLLKS